MKNTEDIVLVLNSLKINEIISEGLVESAKCGNVWFNDANIGEGVERVREMLSRDNLERWSSCFGREKTNPKRVAVVVDGAAPFDGLTDLVLVLLSGNIFVGRGFENDLLLRSVADALIKADGALADYISFVEEPVGKSDAIILSGSFSSNKTLMEYVDRIPHLVHSAGHGTRVLTGNESAGELDDIARGCFLNFGRGEMSVRNLFVPKGYDFQRLLCSFEKWEDVRNNPRYYNNYEYRKSTCIVGKVPCLDNGFVILRASDGFSPHIGEIYYHEYSSLSEVGAIDGAYDAAGETIMFLLSI